MKWTVTWVPPAETELAALWLDGNIRGAVTEAARRIERALRSDPANQGESREGDFRVMFETPLGVSFRVLPDERLVQVLDVWLTIPKG
jgi:hypothetical protein